MGKLKEAALATTTPKVPEQLTYALTAFTAQRRRDGWYVTPAWTAYAGERPTWRGPFDTIDNTCTIIAAFNREELTRRYEAHVESYRLKARNPLNGLKRIGKR